MSSPAITYEVRGRVSDGVTLRPLPGLSVVAFDRDLFFHDRLGSCETDESGEYAIQFTDASFRGPFEGTPEVFIVVEAGERELHRSEPVRLTTFQNRLVLDVALPGGAR